MIVADGRCLEIEGVGNVSFSCKKGNNGNHRFDFKEVSFAPELDSNLLSMDKLSEEGYDVFFSKRKCNISKNGLTLVSIPSRNGLYEIRPMNQANLASNSKGNSQSDCIHTWHRRLGHRNVVSLKEMVVQNTVEGIAIKESCKCSDNICSVCPQGKMSRKKFPKESSGTSRGVLELVHSDLMGPIERRYESFWKPICTNAHR